MTLMKLIASFICVGLFILIVWLVTGFGPTSWQCWILSISANLMLLPGILKKASEQGKDKR